KAITLDPKSSSPVMALGVFYARQRQLQEADQQFRRAIELDPKNPSPYGAQARVYVAEGKENDAVEVLKQAKQALSDNSDGYRMLGEFYVQSGKMDKALEEYASLYRDHPKDRRVIMSYIQLLIENNRLDEATMLNDKVLKENPNAT